MSTATDPVNAAAPVAPVAMRHAPSPRGARWVAKRALIGLFLLLTFAFGGAMLFDASIDANADENAAVQSEE